MSQVHYVNRSTMSLTYPSSLPASQFATSSPVRYQLFCTAELSPFFIALGIFVPKAAPIFSDQPPNHPSPPTLHFPLGARSSTARRSTLPGPKSITTTNSTATGSI